MNYSKCVLAIVALCLVIYCHSACVRKPIEGDAKCIDGSSPVYYLSKGSGSGSNKWHIHFQGGGWCSDMDSCKQRSGTVYGSTLYDIIDKNKDVTDCDNFHDGKLMKDFKYLSTVEEINPYMYNWNIVFVHYCDGGSFAGNTEVKDKISKKTFYFHGARIRRGVIDQLLHTEHMNNATEVLISGCSAGGIFVCMYVI